MLNDSPPDGGYVVEMSFFSDFVGISVEISFDGYTNDSTGLNTDENT